MWGYNKSLYLIILYLYGKAVVISQDLAVKQRRKIEGDRTFVLVFKRNHNNFEWRHEACSGEGEMENARERELDQLRPLRKREKLECTA